MKRRKMPRARSSKASLAGRLPGAFAASANAPPCGVPDRRFCSLPNSLGCDAASRVAHVLRLRAKVSRTRRPRQLRIEQAMHVDDEIAHVRVVHRALGRSLPGLVGFG